MKQRKVVNAMFLVLLLLAVFPTTAFAFATRSGEQVEVKSDETINGDLYITGNQILIAGTVKGDLFILGADAVISGTVEGDLFFGGRTLTLLGEVKDDVRMGGTAFTLGPTGKIGDDFLAGGYSIETQPGSRIGGQMIVGANQVLLGGTSVGDVNAAVNGFQLDGSVQGNLNVTTAAKNGRIPFNPMQFFPNAPRLPIVAPGLAIGTQANIGGNLNYQSPGDQEFKTGDQRIKGDVAFTAATIAAAPTPQQQLMSAGQRALSRFLGTLLVGLLLLWLVPTFLRRTATVLQGNFGGGIGWGVLGYLGLPIVLLLVLGVVALISVAFNAFGYGWAVDGLVSAAILSGLLILALFIFVIVLIGKVAVAAWLGRLLTGQRDPQRGRLFWPMVFGLVLVAILIAIPYAGVVFNLIFSVLGLGAVWLALRGQVGTNNRRPHPYALQ